MTRRIIFFIAVFITIGLNSNAKNNWEFSNSTPQKLIKSHFYFVKGPNKNLDLAIYTFQNNGLKTSTQKIRVRELYEILKKLKLNINEVSNRRKGLSKNNKYYLFPKEKKIYLIRIDHRWFYSKETIKAIPKLYRKYILTINSKANKGNYNKTEYKLPDSIPVKLDLSTPYHTILSHLLFTSDSLYNPELAAKCIDFDASDTAQKEILAVKLSQIFYGARKHIFTLEEISNDTFYVDSLTNKHIYYPNPEIKEFFLVKVGKQWKYSKTTASLIESIHETMYGNDAEEIFSFGDRFKRLLGEDRNIKFLNLYLWQFVMLLFFISLFILVYFLNKLIIRKLIRKFIRNRRLTKNISPLINMISLLIVAEITVSYGPAFEFPIGINHLFLKLLDVLAIFFNTVAAIYTVNIITVLLTKEDRFDNKFGLVYFISLIVKLIIFVISLIFIIKALEYDLISVLTGLSIGGFALALGAQDTVKNFFGSLMIFADHSFSVGDWITVGNVSGTVEQIGLRSTRIRTFHNSLVTVPNSKLSDNNIDNMGKRKFRRYKGNILIKYDTPPEKIETFIEKIREEIKNTEIIRQDFNMVYINNFDKYGLEILIYVFFIVPNWDEEMKAKHQLISKILKFKEELEIEFVRVPLLEGN